MLQKREEVYDTYWKLAAERQEIFFKKIKGEKPPYTKDPILQSFKFCNVYRASDRVSQFLIKDVIYNSKNQTEEETLFRIFLFRLLNKIETWQKLEKKLGEISLKGFNFETWSEILTNLKEKEAIYGNAFILCANKSFGYSQKHKNHLKLLEHLFYAPERKNAIIQAKSLERLFERLKELPLIGDFMAYQIAIDFNYSEIFNFNENDFTIPGPGAKRGIAKCFSKIAGVTGEEIILSMVENQEKEFARRGLGFRSLWGRPMHAIDVQGMFCELDKYCRVRFPNLKSPRTKIKSKYKPKADLISYFYPPKWGINNLATKRDKLYFSNLLQ